MLWTGMFCMVVNQISISTLLWEIQVELNMFTVLSHSLRHIIIPFISCHFLNALYIIDILSFSCCRPKCVYFHKSSSFRSLTDSSSSHHSSLHLLDSLSSGSIKSLLICPFLLIWIHTGPNCWLGSAKETSLNEVYKTHIQPLSLCVVIFVHTCVFMSTFVVCVCVSHKRFTDYYFNLHHIPFQNIHSVFLLCYTHFSFGFSSSLPHFLFPCFCPTSAPILKPSHLQILYQQL